MVAPFSFAIIMIPLAGVAYQEGGFGSTNVFSLVQYGERLLPLISKKR